MVAVKSYSRKAIVLERPDGESQVVIIRNDDDAAESMRVARLLVKGVKKHQIDMTEGLAILQGIEVISSFNQFDYLD